jgi:hypothetical protein
VTIHLHKDCKRRLLEIVQSALAEVSVTNGMFIERGSSRALFGTDSALPQTGEVHESLVKYVGEMPGYEFIYETLARELRDGEKYNTEDTPKPLRTIARYDDLAAVAERLVDALALLPNRYVLTVPLPNSIGVPLIEGIGPFSFSSDILLARIDEGFRSKHPLTEGREGARFSDIFRPGWADTAAALQLNIAGFVGVYGNSAPLEEAMARLRSFLGLGIALRLFKVERTFRSTTPGLIAYVHRLEGAGKLFDRDVRLDAATAAGLLDLALDDLEGRISTQKLRTAFHKGVTDQLVCTLDQTDKASKILLGGQWLFDSHSATDDLLAFVQAAGVLEIILGDKAASEVVGLGELLRNRCAYLVGKTRSQREEILDDFQKIYEVRSRIVHSGKRRLTRDERGLLFKLQWLCNRVVQEEVDLLKRDAVRPAAKKAAQ